MVRAEVLFRPDSEQLRYLPEGPTWLRHGAAAGRVAWVAIQHGPRATTGSINLLDLEARSSESIPLPGRPGFLAQTDRPGTLLVGMDRRLVLFDLEARRIEETGLRVEEHPATIVNDGVGAPFGAVFGTKDPGFAEPIAGLYLYRQGAARLVRLRAGQTCSNGKVLLHEEDRWQLLDIDTPTRRIVRYRIDPEAGKLGDAATVADFTGDESFPDGMVATPDGRSVVVAFYDPTDAACGEARQISLATGEVEAVWTTPGSPQVTCPELVSIGGEVKLLLTTAAENMDAEKRRRHPEAGSLFIADTEFDGAPGAPALVPLAGMPRG